MIASMSKWLWWFEMRITERPKGTFSVPRAVTVTPDAARPRCSEPQHPVPARVHEAQEERRDAAHEREDDGRDGGEDAPEHDGSINRALADPARARATGSPPYNPRVRRAGFASGGPS